MPTRRLKRTKAQDREYRDILSELKGMGVLVECADDPPPGPDRLTVEQIDHELATVYELPLGKIAVVVCASLTVLVRGIWITDCEMTTTWESPSLDLSDPKESPYYDCLLYTSDADDE